ncbi:Serine/threonine-protein phosphatase 6 regulatory ankyrin repeat subunit B [Halotydeus destructor]|nr:Serine/threonine-protein phosphatase 6 regulatory ankyrin repeat subunit B [Halotydeus destructor]
MAEPRSRERSSTANTIWHKSNIKELIKQGNLSTLEEIVIQGHGDRLLGETSTMPLVDEFLQRVPSLLEQIGKLHKVSMKGSVTDFRSLLDHKHILLSRDQTGGTPLHKAVIYGHVDLVQYIANNFPVTLDARDQDGRTPLHYATALEDRTIYNVLVKAGASPIVLDSKGRSSEFYLRFPDQIDISRMMKRSQRLNANYAINTANRIKSKSPVRKRNWSPASGRSNEHSSRTEGHTSDGDENGSHDGSSSGSSIVQPSSSVTLPSLTRAEVTSANLKNWLEEQNFSALDGAVLEGYGDRIKTKAQLFSLTEQQDFANVQDYVTDTLPKIMSKIRTIHAAVSCGDVACLQDILDKKDYALAKDHLGMAPLHKAVIVGHLDVVQFILEKFPETINAKDRDGRTALHYAAATTNRNGNRIYKMLIRAGADSRIRDVNGKSAEYYRVHLLPLPNELSRLASTNSKRKVPEILTPLLRRRPTMLPSIQEKVSSALHGGDASQLYELALDGYGDAILGRSSWGEEARKFIRGLPHLMDKIKRLHKAIVIGDLETVQQALTAEPNLTRAKDENGFMPIHLATYHNNREIVEYLCRDFGNSVILRDHSGRTSLHLAAQNKNDEIYRILVTAGADPRAFDLRGKTPENYYKVPTLSELHLSRYYNGYKSDSDVLSSKSSTASKLSPPNSAMKASKSAINVSDALRIEDLLTSEQTVTNSEVDTENDETVSSTLPNQDDKEEEAKPAEVAMEPEVDKNEFFDEAEVESSELVLQTETESNDIVQPEKESDEVVIEPEVETNDIVERLETKSNEMVVQPETNSNEISVEPEVEAKEIVVEPIVNVNDEVALPLEEVKPARERKRMKSPTKVKAKKYQSKSLVRREEPKSTVPVKSRLDRSKTLPSNIPKKQNSKEKSSVISKEGISVAATTVSQPEEAPKKEIRFDTREEMDPSVPEEVVTEIAAQVVADVSAQAVDVIESSEVNEEVTGLDEQPVEIKDEEEKTKEVEDLSDKPKETEGEKEEERVEDVEPVSAPLLTEILPAVTSAEDEDAELHDFEEAEKAVEEAHGDGSSCLVAEAKDEDVLLIEKVPEEPVPKETQEGVTVSEKVEAPETEVEHTPEDGDTVSEIVHTIETEAAPIFEDGDAAVMSVETNEQPEASKPEVPHESDDDNNVEDKPLEVGLPLADDDKVNKDEQSRVDLPNPEPSAPEAELLDQTAVQNEEHEINAVSESAEVVDSVSLLSAPLENQDEKEPDKDGSEEVDNRESDTASASDSTKTAVFNDAVLESDMAANAEIELETNHGAKLDKFLSIDDNEAALIHDEDVSSEQIEVTKENAECEIDKTTEVEKEAVNKQSDEKELVSASEVTADEAVSSTGRSSTSPKSVSGISRRNHSGTSGSASDNKLDELIDVWIREGDLMRLEHVVIAGQGERLIGKQCPEQQNVQDFLNLVPAYIEKIRTVHESVVSGNFKQVRQVLTRKRFALSRDAYGASPLHLAVLHGHLDVLVFIVSQFPETIDGPDNEGRTPLHYAAVVGDNDNQYYELLKKAGAQDTVLDKAGHSPAYYLEHAGELTVRQLLENYRKSTPKSPSVADLTADEADVWQRPPTADIVSRLTPSPGSSVDIDEAGRNKTQEISADVHVDADHRLVKEHSLDKEEAEELETMSNQFREALKHEKSRLKESTEKLLEKAPSLGPESLSETESESAPDTASASVTDGPPFELVQVKNEHGETILHKAASVGQKSSLLYMMLKECPYLLAERDEQYRTLREVAVYRGLKHNVQTVDRFILDQFLEKNVSFVRMLAQEGFDICNVVDDDGQDITSLLERQNLSSMISLLQDISYFEKSKDELHTFIKNDYYEGAVRTISANDKLITAKNRRGKCSLHIAILFGNMDLIEILVRTNPQSVHVQDNLGRTPLHYSMATSKAEEIGRLLLKNGSRTTTRDVRMRTPSYYYVYDEEIKAIKKEEMALS